MNQEIPPPSSSRLWPRLRFLVAELGVVFLGVSSAFVLDGCRERRAREDLRDRIHESLRGDLEQLRGEMQGAERWFDETFVEGFLVPYEAGERPMLHPVPVPATAPDQGWSAILAAGGLDVLDLEVIRSVETLMATLHWASSQANEYNAYVRAILAPELGGEEVDLGAFYVPEKTTLRGKYLWYPYSLSSMREAIRNLKARIEDVEAALEASGR